MIKVTLVCDSCGSIIASGISANTIRVDARALYRRHGNRDLCLPGQSFPYSWTRDGEPYGAIRVRIEPGAVVLSFRARACESAAWESVEQNLPVVWTPCHLGGGRPWFRCTASANGQYCGRRVAILYLGGSAGFACRHCYGLAYASQLESARYRGLGKARKIRMRLGGGTNLLDTFPPKPKRMHPRTYNRFRALYGVAAVQCGAISTHLGEPDGP